MSDERRPHILDRDHIQRHFQSSVSQEPEIPILAFLNNILSFMIRGPESVPQWTLPGSYADQIVPVIRHTTVMTPSTRDMANALTDFIGANASAVVSLIREDIREAISEAFATHPDIQRFTSVTGLNPSLITASTMRDDSGAEILTDTGQRVQELFQAAQDAGQNPFVLVNYLYAEGRLNDTDAADSILSMGQENWDGQTVLALMEYEARNISPTEDIEVSPPGWQHWMDAPTEVNPNGPIAFLNDARATLTAAPVP